MKLIRNVCNQSTSTSCWIRFSKTSYRSSPILSNKLRSKDSFRWLSPQSITERSLSLSSRMIRKGPFHLQISESGQSLMYELLSKLEPLFLESTKLISKLNRISVGVIKSNCLIERTQTKEFHFWCFSLDECRTHSEWINYWDQALHSRWLINNSPATKR